MSSSGLPLLSGPPPPTDSTHAEIACRKCGKEFNMIFARARKCNHCGYSYCHSCSDYQALMPRQGPEQGYDPMHVCAFCIEYLTITAAGRQQLKQMSLAKLKKYIQAYNIKAGRVVEKDDLIDAILSARGPNGCLPPTNENYYRKYSVPNKTPTTRPRGLFSSARPQPAGPGPSTNAPPPPTPPRPEFARPDLAPDNPPPPPPHAPRPQYAPPPPQQPQQQQQQYNPPPNPPPRPHSAYANTSTANTQNYYQQYHTPPPPQAPRPPPQGGGYPGQGAHYYQGPPPPPQYSRPQPQFSYTPRPPQPPRPSTQRPSQPHPQTQPPQPPPRPRTVSTTPPPSLDQLLTMSADAIGSLSISALKDILFRNHVASGQVLEKGDLVRKVLMLVETEKAERERHRQAEEREEMERVQREMERREQERVRREREAASAAAAAAAAAAEAAEQEQQQQQERQREDTAPPSSEQAPPTQEAPAAESSTTAPATEGPDSQPQAAPPTSSSPKPAPTPAAPKNYASTSTLDRSGLCVICQDEEANIAIVDCGHLAMCRGCSDLVMSSTRECPLCRTRIVTEARLLRIYRT